MSGRKEKAADPRALKVVARSPEHPLQFGVENAFPHLPDTGSWDDFYVNFSGYYGAHGPHVFAAAPDLLAALDGVMDILGRAESNASGNPDFDYVGPRVAKARAAIAKARGQ